MYKSLQVFLQSPQVTTLKYPPRYESGEIVCYRCGLKTTKLQVHHHHDSNENIAILCGGCNHAVKNATIITHCDPSKRSIYRKRSVDLSVVNFKWLKTRHINVSDLVESLITEYRQKMDGISGQTAVKEIVRRALLRELSPDSTKLLPPESPKEDGSHD